MSNPHPVTNERIAEAAREVAMMFYPDLRRALCRPNTSDKKRSIIEEILRDESGRIVAILKHKLQEPS